MLPCTAVQTRDQTHLMNGHVYTMQAIQTRPAADQDNVSSQMNPAPVPASSGQTAVTQVVTPNSQKRPPLGLLTQTPCQQSYRFRHDVDLQKHPKVGFLVIIMSLMRNHDVIDAFQHTINVMMRDATCLPGFEHQAWGLHEVNGAVC